MSSNFEWRTAEDDNVWEQTDTPAPPPTPHRRWRFLSVVLLLGLIVALVVGRQVNRRVAEVTSMVEQDVRAADNLARSAAAAADVELFVSVLSGRDPAWTETQQALLVDNLLFGGVAAPLGLTGDAPPLTATVLVDSSLNQAVVQTMQPFVLTLAEGVTATVTLEQTHVYRRGGRSWLLAPPEPEFWGEWQTRSGQYVTMAYPQRDAAFATEFANHLDQEIGRLCLRFPSLACPADLRVNVRLDPNPDSLLALLEPARALAPGREVNLPAPTLIGLPRPDDEAAYQALYRGYATQVVSALIADLVDYRCCDGLVIFQPLLDKLLQQLALRPWPQLAYDPLLAYATLPDILPWDGSSPAGIPDIDRLSGYALVTLLVDEGWAAGQDVVDLQRSLASSSSISAWLYSATANRLVNDADVDQAWRQWLRQQVQQAQQAQIPPAGLPNQDLLLSCQTLDPPSLTLWRYSLAKDEWTAMADLAADFGLLTSLPQRDGAMLFMALPEAPPQTVLWRSGQQYPVASSDTELLLTLDYPPDPQGQYLLGWGYPLIETLDFQSSNYLIDPAGCTTAGCKLIALPGVVAWSTDGAQLLAADGAGQLQLRARQAEAWTPAGNGIIPFWLDETTYGFVSEANSQVNIARMGAAESRPLLRVEALSPLLPASLQRFRLVIQDVFHFPNVPNALFIAASHGFSSESYLFRVQLPDESVAWWDSDPAGLELTLLFDGRGLYMDFPSQLVSPDGRWLQAYAPGSDGHAAGQVLLYDLPQSQVVFRADLNESPVIQGFAWADEGNWSAYRDFDYIALLSPTGDQADSFTPWYVFPPDGNCLSLTWVNP